MNLGSLIEDNCACYPPRSVRRETVEYLQKIALSGGVGANALWQTGECNIQFSHSRPAYFHHLARIAPPPHFLLLRLPLYRQCSFHSACSCKSDCWIELVEM